jgi:pimeloyl-ACP methyl ester carboxylesterase
MHGSSYSFSSNETIHFHVIGNGPCQIVFLHGFAASLHTWDDIAPLFPSNEFTLHLLDLKGHGRSSKPSDGDYSALHNARLIAGYIHSRMLRDITVIGHSFGGLVGLLTALECPEITRLILIGAPGFPQKIPRFMRLLRLPFIGPLLMAAVPADRIARKGLEAVFYRQELITGRLIERYAAGYRQNGSARALANTVRQILPPYAAKLTARYGALSISVLMLWGEHDRVVKLWQGEQLARELKNSRLAIIPGCGHNPHEERPEETFFFIRDFLAESCGDKRDNSY